MNASKTLIAAIAAATIVGTVGFVSAQTPDPAPNATATTQDTQQPAPETTTAPSTAPADMSAPPYVAPETSAAPATSTAAPVTPPSDAAMPAEPAPKADRN